jgi:pyruvate dehydrogenase (quinone)/pyruvate oxidase
VARGFGAASFVIDNPKRCGAILEQALATEGPVVIEAIVDPNTPPLPAKIKAKQALHLAEALARGEKDAAGIIKSIAGGKVRELV